MKGNHFFQFHKWRIGIVAVLLLLLVLILLSLDVTPFGDQRLTRFANAFSNDSKGNEGVAILQPVKRTGRRNAVVDNKGNRNRSHLHKSVDDNANSSFVDGSGGPADGDDDEDGTKGSDGTTFETLPPEVCSLLVTFIQLGIPEDMNITDAFMDGIMAASRSLPTCYSFTVVSGNASISISDQLNLLTEEKSYVFGVVGPMSDHVLQEMTEYNKEKKTNLMSMGPYVANPALVTGNVNHYFIRPPPQAEFYAMVMHILEELHIKRAGLMFLKGCPLSEALYPILIEALAEAHNTVPIEYSQSVQESSLDLESFSTFLNAEPQMVFIIAGKHPITTAFAEQFSVNPQAIGVPLFVSTALFDLVLNISRKYTDFDFRFTLTNLFATNTDAAYISDFNSDLSAYYDTGIGIGFLNIQEMKDSLYNHYTVYGWLVGQVIQSSLNNPINLLDVENYRNNLYSDVTYTISDSLSYGPYYGVKKTELSTESTKYEWLSDTCNQGGHVVHIFALSSSTPSPILRGTYDFSSHECGLQNYTLPYYEYNIIFAYENNDALSKVALKMRDGFQYSSLHTLANSSSVSSGTMTQSVNVVKMSSGVSPVDYCDGYGVDAVVGPLEDATSVSQRMTNTLIVDPVDTHALLRIQNPTVVYLMPTLEQQVFIAAEVSKMKGYACAILLRQNDVFQAIKSTIQKISSFLDVKVKTYEINNALEDILLGNGFDGEYVLLLNLLPTDTKTIRQFLEKHPDRFFGVLYEGFALHYDVIQRTFSSATESVRQRFVTQTNLPTWTDNTPEAESKYPGIKDYHSCFNNVSDTSPSTLQGWYTAGMVKLLLSAKASRRVSTVEDSIYSKPVYQYGGITFSLTGDATQTFNSVSSTASIHSSSPSSSSSSSFFNSAPFVHTKSSASKINYAAININVISFYHIGNPQSPVSFGPFTPDVAAALDVPSRSRGSNLNMVLSLTLPLCTAICVMVGLLLYFCCCASAPPPASNKKPVTFLVCDIHRSSGLWAACPQEMVKATNTYQSIVRKLVKIFHCYEVKNIGDVFLIVSDDATRIVNLSVAIQRELFNCQWGTQSLDIFYIQNERSAAVKMLKAHEEGDGKKLEKMNDGERATDGEEDADVGDEDDFENDVTCCHEQRGQRKSFEDDNDTAPPPSLSLSDDDLQKLMESDCYCHHWNGLRVRMGIHTGLCDILLDNTKKAVDYQGDTVHIAARTEQRAHGGQILMTQSTWDYLRENNLLPKLYSDTVVIDAGARILRGIALPVQMYEVEAIDGREWKVPVDLLHDDGPRHAAITPCEMELLEEEDENDDLVNQFFSASPPSTATSAAPPILRTREAENVYHVMVGLFSSYSPRERLSHLAPLLEQWHVPTQVPPDMDEDARFETLMQRLCNRTAGVVESQQKQRSDLVMQSSMVSAFSKSLLCECHTKPGMNVHNHSVLMRSEKMGRLPHAAMKNMDVTAGESCVSHGVISMLGESEMGRNRIRSWAVNPFARAAHTTSEGELLQASNISGVSGAGDMAFFLQNVGNEDLSQYGVSFGGVGGSEGISFGSGGGGGESHWGFSAAVGGGGGGGDDLFSRDRSLSSFRRRSQFTNPKNPMLFRPRITSFAVPPSAEDGMKSQSGEGDDFERILNAERGGGYNGVDLHSTFSISQSRRPLNEISNPSVSMIPYVSNADPLLPPAVPPAALMRFPRCMTKPSDGVSDDEHPPEKRFVIRRPQPNGMHDRAPTKPHDISPISGRANAQEEDILPLRFTHPPPPDGVLPWPTSQQLPTPELRVDHTQACRGTSEEEIDSPMLRDDDNSISSTSLTRKANHNGVREVFMPRKRLEEEGTPFTVDVERAKVTSDEKQKTPKEIISIPRIAIIRKAAMQGGKEEKRKAEGHMGTTTPEGNHNNNPKNTEHFSVYPKEGSEWIRKNNSSGALMTRETACFYDNDVNEEGLKELNDDGFVENPSILSSVHENNMANKDGHATTMVQRYTTMSTSLNVEEDSPTPDLLSAQDSGTALLPDGNGGLEKPQSNKIRWMQ